MAKRPSHQEAVTPTTGSVVTSMQATPERATDTSVQKDASSAGHAALADLRRRIEAAREAGTSLPLTLLVDPSFLLKVQACLDRLVAGDKDLTPVFLAAGPYGSDGLQQSDSALPGNVLGAAFVDKTAQAVVLLAHRLSFRAMVDLAPALLLMAVAQRFGKEAGVDAGSLFQGLSKLVSSRKPFPQWEIVQGVVQGCRLHGFGLLSTGVKAARC